MPRVSQDVDGRPLYVALGIDCDPDRDAPYSRPTWRGVERLPALLDLPDVKWTFNIRADTHIRDRCGSARYCYEHFRDIWEAAKRAGSAIAWHLHYYDRHGRQDTSTTNILENIRVGTAALDRPDIVHMGWTFQNAFSIRELVRVGVRIDYSPIPRVRFDGRHGVDGHDWWTFAYRPQVWHGMRMIPAFTFPHWLLRRRFGTERVMLTTTTAPPLYRLLLREFFRTGADFFVSYFHADELVPAVGGWRNRLYTFRHLQVNLERLRTMAAARGHEVRFVTIREMASILFDEDPPGYA